MAIWQVISFLLLIYLNGVFLHSPPFVFLQFRGWIRFVYILLRVSLHDKISLGFLCFSNNYSPCAQISQGQPKGMAFKMQYEESHRDATFFVKCIFDVEAKKFSWFSYFRFIIPELADLACKHPNKPLQSIKKKCGRKKNCMDAYFPTTDLSKMQKLYGVALCLGDYLHI